jgi:hypothetical protein
VETRWSEAQMTKLISGVLASRYALHRLDRIAENGWDPVSRQWTGDGSDGDAASVGYARNMEYLQRLRTVHASPPAGFLYRLQITSVNNCDPKEIRKVALRKKPHSMGPTAAALRSARGESSGQGGVGAVSSIRVHEEYHDGREMFAVGVHVQPLHNQLASVLVGLMVVYPDPDSHGNNVGAELPGQGEQGSDEMENAVMAA